MPRLYVYDVSAIPDCTDHRLVMLCGGAVRDHVFAAFEHLLRMIANFDEGQLALAFRYLFDPDVDGGRQERLRLQIAVKICDNISEEIVHQLIDVGPLCEFYRFSDRRKVESLEISEFPYACDIIRREDRVEAQLPRELNRYVPSSGFYYSPVSCEAREENDYLTIDTLLSRIQEPCSIEFLVSPVDHTPEQVAHEKYIRQLMAINDYGEDLYLGSSQHQVMSDISGDIFADNTKMLENTKKKDPTADEILHEQQEFHQKLRQPQLLFNVKAYAMQPEIALMLSSAVAEAGLSEGKYRQLPYGANGGIDGNDVLIARSRQDTRIMNISLDPLYPGIWNKNLPDAWMSLRRLNRLASVDELKGLFRIPVGGYGSPRCIRKSTDPKTNGLSARTSILLGDDLESELPLLRKVPENLDELFISDHPKTLESRLTQKVLTKHLFIAGVPGSGKTTAVFNLLVQLYRQGIPFLVIEPAKTEYRVFKTISNHPDPLMRKMAADIRVYTPGNEGISPLRFNPLSFPKGITLDEHIGQVLACFEAAMPMGGPLQALIAEAVEEVYERSDSGSFPQMVDLLDAASSIMESKNYEGEIKSNLHAAIGVRLGLLTRRAIGRLFRTSDSIPEIRELLSHPTIIEMDYLPQDHACLLTLFLLAAMREEMRIDPERRRPGLHHITVIEEAHNIVGRTGDAKASEDNTDPKAFAAHYVSRMLAELRALGEGIIIADQLPSTVAPEVVKNTGTKLAHRLVSNEDREDLGGAMLMGPTEIEEIARLAPGEAYVYTENLYKPRRIRCLNSNAYLRTESQPIPVGAEILCHLEKDNWFWQNAEKRAIAFLQQMEKMQHIILNHIDDARDDLNQPDGFLTRFQRALELQDPDEMKSRLQNLWLDLLDTEEELDRMIKREYLSRTVRPQIPALMKAAEKSEIVRDLFERLVETEKTAILEVTENLIGCIDALKHKMLELIQ